MFHPSGPSLLELTRQALSSTERGYDLLAPKFDRTPFCTPEPIIEAAINFVGPFQNALDLCCGTGVALPLLRARCSGDVVGVDFSEGMLAEARNRVKGTNVQLLRVDALALPFQNRFDTCVCFGALGHILPRDQSRFLQNVHRALRPAGSFVFATAEHPPLLSLQHLQARVFNTLMHVRNAVWMPPFIMYYLTFLLPDCLELLRRHRFHSTVASPDLSPPFHHMRIVKATKR
jgi:SAM-dependent methyltransferase